MVIFYGYIFVDGGFCVGEVFWWVDIAGVISEGDASGACDIASAQEFAIMDSTLWVGVVDVTGGGGTTDDIVVDTDVVVGATGGIGLTWVVAMGPSWYPSVTLAWYGWVPAGGI